MLRLFGIRRPLSTKPGVENFEDQDSAARSARQSDSNPPLYAHTQDCPICLSSGRWHSGPCPYPDRRNARRRFRTFPESARSEIPNGDETFDCWNEIHRCIETDRQLWLELMNRTAR